LEIVIGLGNTKHVKSNFQGKILHKYINQETNLQILFRC